MPRYACGSAAVYMRGLRATHKLLGLCSKCKAKALPGRCECLRHYRQRKAKQQRRDA